MTIKELFDDLYDLYKNDNEILIAISIYNKDKYIIIENNIKKLIIRIKENSYLLEKWSVGTFVFEPYKIQKFKDIDELFDEIMFTLAVDFIGDTNE